MGRVLVRSGRARAVFKTAYSPKIKRDDFKLKGKTLKGRKGLRTTTPKGRIVPPRARCLNLLKDCKATSRGENRIRDGKVKESTQQGP